MPRRSNREATVRPSGAAAAPNEFVVDGGEHTGGVRGACVHRRTFAKKGRPDANSATGGAVSINPISAVRSVP